MHDNPLEDQTDAYVFMLTTHLTQSFCKFTLKSNLAQVPDVKNLKAWTKMETRECCYI